MTAAIEGIGPGSVLAVLVGTDLVEVASVEASIATFGDRYLRRVYTERELEHCSDSAGAVAAQHLAARFAAKEAVVKALRMTDGVSYHGVEVRNDEYGAAVVELRGAARHAATRAGVFASGLSLTHEGAYAAATFVAIAATSPNEKEPR